LAITARPLKSLATWRRKREKDGNHGGHITKAISGPVFVSRAGSKNRGWAESWTCGPGRGSPRGGLRPIVGKSVTLSPVSLDAGGKRRISRPMPAKIKTHYHRKQKRSTQTTRFNCGFGKKAPGRVRGERAKKTRRRGRAGMRQQRHREEETDRLPPPRQTPCSLPHLWRRVVGKKDLRSKGKW